MYQFPNHLSDGNFLVLLGTGRDTQFILSHKKLSHEEAQAGVHPLIMMKSEEKLILNSKYFG